MISYVSLYFVLISYLAYFHSSIFDQPYRGKNGDLNDVKDSYAFIIIGSGSAGSVVARRIADLVRQNRDHLSDYGILLIEAGGQQSVESKIPMFLQEAASSNDAWVFRTWPQKRVCQANRGECMMPRGRTMGGSSSINAMIYLRGNPKDFDDWEAQGNPGWNSQVMFQQFLKQERITVPELYGDYHSSEGQLTVSQNSFRTPLASAYLEAGKQLGFDVADLNGENRTGFMYFQGTIDEDGRRMSSNRAFLDDFIVNPNPYGIKIDVTLNTVATKILFEGNRAIGVVVEKNGVKRIIQAKHEVLLCAGTIASPQLLMLSGVGPKEELESLGIPLVADLPVGEHLQDHLGVGLNFVVHEGLAINEEDVFSPKAMEDFTFRGTGPLSTPYGIEAVAFVNATSEERQNDYPDIELIMSSYGLRDSWRVGGFQLRPKSVGRLTLRSKSINDHPIINPEYLLDPYDLEVMIQIVKYGLELARTPAMSQFGSRLIQEATPNCPQDPESREFAECMVREYSTSLHHQVGTCRMHKDGVVDPSLKVHGLEGIRVIDASIIPSIPSSNINAIVMAIAGVALDIMEQEYAQN